jgi:hypothetical protein
VISECKFEAFKSFLGMASLKQGPALKTNPKRQTQDGNSKKENGTYRKPPNPFP